MRTLLSLTLTALLFASCTTSRRISVFVTPETAPVASEPVDVAAYEAKYGRYEGVFLSVEHSIEHYGTKESGYNGIGATWKFVRIKRQKYIVLDPEADWLTSFRIYTVPDELYLRVTTPDGRVRTYNKNHLKEEKDEDGYTWHTLVYPDIVKGTVIEEAWEVAYSVSYYPPLDHDIALQFRIPCEKLKLTYACPDWWTLAVKKTAEDHYTPVDYNYQSDAKKMILSYEATDIPALRHEPYSPYLKEVAEYLQFHVVDLEMKGGKFNRRQSWQKLADDFSKFALKKVGKGKKEVRRLAENLIKDCRTDLDKVDTIVSYVQNNFEVTRKNRDANLPKILKEGEGDALDLCALALTLLDYAGFNVGFLLVHSATDGYFDPNYFDGDQFQAPAVRVLIDSVNYVVFPYLKFLPINHTPARFQGQSALQIANGIATIWKVPPGNRADNTVGEEYYLEISETGTIGVRERRVASGYPAYLTREALRMMDERETDEYMRDLLTYTDGDIKVDSFTVVNPEAYKEPLTIDLYYRIENLVTVLPDEAIFQTGGLFSPISYMEYRQDPEERNNPIKIAYDEQHDKSITIRYPERWSLVTELSDVSFQNEFGLISGSYTPGPGHLTVTQQVLLNRSFEHRSKIGRLLSLIGSKSELNLPAIVFAIGDEAPPVAGDADPTDPGSSFESQ